jgi:hypothetical protein
MNLYLILAQGDTAALTFNGTSCYLYGAMRPNHGMYAVNVDGQTTSNNGSRDPNAFQTLLYGNSDLPYGEHQVTLTNTGAPGWVDLDYVVLTVGDGTKCVPSAHLICERMCV